MQHIKSDLISMFMANNISVIAPIRKFELQMGIFSWIFHPSSHQTQVTLENMHLNRKNGNDTYKFGIKSLGWFKLIHTICFYNFDCLKWHQLILFEQDSYCFGLKILRVSAMSQIGLNCLSTHCAEQANWVVLLNILRSSPFSSHRWQKKGRPTSTAGSS